MSKCFLLRGAYKRADGKKIDNRRVLVDVERGRTIPGWKPRRLGGEKGGRKSHNADSSVNESKRAPSLDGDVAVDRRENRDRGDRGDRGERDRDRDRSDRNRDRGHDRDKDRGDRGERDRGDRSERKRSEDRPKRRSRSRSKDKERRKRSKSKGKQLTSHLSALTLQSGLIFHPFSLPQIVIEVAAKSEAKSQDAADPAKETSAHLKRRLIQQ